MQDITTRDTAPYKTIHNTIHTKHDLTIQHNTRKQHAKTQPKTYPKHGTRNVSKWIPFCPKNGAKMGSQSSASQHLFPPRWSHGHPRAPKSHPKAPKSEQQYPRLRIFSMVGGTRAAKISAVNFWAPPKLPTLVRERFLKKLRCFEFLGRVDPENA